MATIVLDFGKVTLEADLYEGPGPEAFLASLPADIGLSRWGDEFYGGCSAKVKEDKTSRDLYEVGEVAFWPPGKAFCVFFGPTPASSDDTPTMASPGVPLGKIKANATSLRSLGSSVRVKITKKG